MNAVYKGKVRDKNGYAVHLFYEYRGHEYMVTDEHNGYSEPMWVKHKNEQERIDREIEEANKPKKEYRYEDTAEYGFNLFWDFVEDIDETTCPYLDGKCGEHVQCIKCKHNPSGEEEQA